MKLTRSSLWTAAATLAFGINGAFAVDCPDPRLPDGKVFTITNVAPAGVAECWDYGNTNVSGNNNIDPVVIFPDWGTLSERVGVVGSDSVAAVKLQLPNTVSLVGDIPEIPGGAGTYPGGKLTITKTTDSSGTFTIGAGLSGPLYLLLKAGSANTPPQWAAFLLPAGTTGGEWFVDPRQGGGLSHASLYAVPLPAAAWLLLSGMVGLFGIGRRRRAS